METGTDEIKTISNKVDNQTDLTSQQSNKNSNDKSDILSDNDEKKETPTVTVNNVTVNYGEIVTIPFNVTDSNGTFISGGAIVTIYGENESISKYVEVNNGTGQVDFNISDLIGIIKVSNGNITDIINIIGSSINITNLNASEIMIGFGEIFSGIQVNITGVMDGLKDITNGISINMTNVIHNIVNNITHDFNMSKIVDAVKAIIGGFSFNASSVNGLLDAVTLNCTNILENSMIILNEFASTLLILPKK